MIQFLFIGTTELLLIGGIALLLFGGKKLPEMMRGLGQGVKEFKKGVNDVKDSVEGDVKKEKNAGVTDEKVRNAKACEGKRTDEEKGQRQ